VGVSTNPITVLDEALRNLGKAVHEAEDAAYRVASIIFDFPDSTAKFIALLHELGDAELDCDSHHGRFESERGKSWDAQSE